MRREWVIWLGFTAVVLVAVVFVVSRNDRDDSKVTAGTSVPTTAFVPPTTATTRPPTASTTSPSTTAGPAVTSPPATTSATTPVVTSGTAATVPPTQPTVVITLPPTTAPPATEPPLRIRVPEGTYRVNIDLPAGTYQTTGGGPYCYWARLRTVTPNPTPADVIASEQTGGSPAVVTIQSTDAAFQTFGCEAWLSV